MFSAQQQAHCLVDTTAQLLTRTSSSCDVKVEEVGVKRWEHTTTGQLPTTNRKLRELLLHSKYFMHTNSRRVCVCVSRQCLCVLMFKMCGLQLAGVVLTVTPEVLISHKQSVTVYSHLCNSKFESVSFFQEFWQKIYRED